MPPVFKRQRATAIIERPEGILVTGMRHVGWLLPGGGVKPGEDPAAAVIREVWEETCLIATEATFLFEYASAVGVQSVFLVVAPGDPAPANEVDQVAFYRPGSSLRLAPITREVLDRYRKQRQ